MFRSASLLLMATGMLMACSNVKPNENEVSSHLKIDAQGSVLECVSSVSFTPEPGIATGTYEDMNEIADHLCGAPAELGKKQSFVGSYPGSKGIRLERVTIEFSCPNSALPLGDRIVDTTELCARVFDNFAAKQQ